MMTEVERRYPNIPLGWAFKGETHANVKNLKADGHGFVMLRAGTSESVIEAIIQLMQKVLERQGSASRERGGRDRTMIVWHTYRRALSVLFIDSVHEQGPSRG